jgi:hypothetical protein
MKTVSKRDEDGVEDEEGRRRCRRDEDGSVRRRWMKTVACMLNEDGGMYKVEEGEDGACQLERNAQGQGLCSIG